MSTESIDPLQSDYYSSLLPLDAAERLYSYEDIQNAPNYFQLDGLPLQLHCRELEPENDGYNPSGIHLVKVHPADAAPTPVTIVRTEESRGAYSAESRFCRFEESGELIELPLARRPWEDAAICVLPDDTIITSGVRVIWNADDPSRHDRFFTEYYHGPSLADQSYIGQSPDGHKDSRIAVVDGQLIIWTRPQQRSFEGKIHYTQLNSVDELSGETNMDGERVANAVYDRCQPVGSGIFADGTWGGPNGAVDVGNGWALIQCHVSRRIFESQALHAAVKDETPPAELLEYDGFMLLHHPRSGRAHIFGSHLSERDFPVGGAKWPKVRRVAFPGGLHEVEVTEEGHVAGKATVGLRDKDMYLVKWRTVNSLAKFLLQL